MLFLNDLAVKYARFAILKYYEKALYTKKRMHILHPLKNFVKQVKQPGH